MREHLLRDEKCNLYKSFQAGYGLSLFPSGSPSLSRHSFPAISSRLRAVEHHDIFRLVSRVQDQGRYFLHTHI